jgi:hypothetical protein
VRTASHRNLLRHSLVLMILVDLSAGFALLANQLFGMHAGWSWAFGALVALPVGRWLHRWAEGVVSGRPQGVEVMFSGEKIP